MTGDFDKASRYTRKADGLARKMENEMDRIYILVNDLLIDRCTGADYTEAELEIRQYMTDSQNWPLKRELEMVLKAPCQSKQL